MKQLDLNSTIGDWISERPHTCHVFASLGLDCCEGSENSLQQVCWERRLTPQDVLAQLHSVVEGDRQDSEAIYVSRLT